MSQITNFSGKYRFLSNFYPSEIEWYDWIVPTAEHAYQMAKCFHLEDKQKILESQYPGVAKSIGKHVKVVPGWDHLKVGIMDRIVNLKFLQNSSLAMQLLATGDARLIEGNYWGDQFWGECPVGIGENHLGLILESVRDKLRNGVL